MNTSNRISVKMWIAHRLPADVQRAIDRVADTEGVSHVVVLPDVHLAGDVCVGLAVASEDRIFPQAVGGDIGCGMTTVALDVSRSRIDGNVARRLLNELRRRVPINRHGAERVPSTFSALEAAELSEASLDTIRRRDGRVQFGTLGRGNHFLEFQADEQDLLWIIVHSGSRAMGPAIRDFHLRAASVSNTGLRYLDAHSRAGQAYVSDAAWACAYAAASRHAMLQAAGEIAAEMIGAKVDESTMIESDHNHVRLETHIGKRWWVHRKGSAHAAEGEEGILPGSMGACSFHVEGRGFADALQSAAHGAGRAMSREQARRSVSGKDFLRQTAGVWISGRIDNLREEAPSAYKDIREILKVQRELVRVVRTLQPVISYKGTR